MTYDNCGVEVRLPYLNGKKPGHNKLFEAVDVTIQGTWEVRVSYDFNDPGRRGNGRHLRQVDLERRPRRDEGYARHISPRFYNNDDKLASLSNMAMHYQVVDDEQ